MALEVEDGTGKADAESYLSVDDLDAMALRFGWATWPAAGQQVPAKEAAARKGTRYMEARYRGRILGASPAWRAPLSTEQRLIFPVLGVFYYPDGFRSLPAGEWLPPEWAEAVGEAIRRAFDGTLSPDLERGGQVLQETVGPITTVYSDGAPGVSIFQEIEDAARVLFDLGGPLRAVRC